MSESDDKRKEQKQILKRLRTERTDHVETVRKDQKRIRETRKALKKALAKESLTVPQIAAAIDRPTDEVLWHVAAMRYYGLVVEDEQDEDYFRYRLVPAKRKGA
jgi:hypothetical protein